MPPPSIQGEQASEPVHMWPESPHHREALGPLVPGARSLVAGTPGTTGLLRSRREQAPVNPALRPALEEISSNRSNYRSIPASPSLSAGFAWEFAECDGRLKPSELCLRQTSSACGS